MSSKGASPAQTKRAHIGSHHPFCASDIYQHHVSALQLDAWTVQSGSMHLCCQSSPRPQTELDTSFPRSGDIMRPLNRPLTRSGGVEYSHSPFRNLTSKDCSFSSFCNLVSPPKEQSVLRSTPPYLNNLFQDSQGSTMASSVVGETVHQGTGRQHSHPPLRHKPAFRSLKMIRAGQTGRSITLRKAGKQQSSIRTPLAVNRQLTV
jgi:hypothetical protein